jgi:hypothetical protein
MFFNFNLVETHERDDKSLKLEKNKHRFVTL